MKSTIRTLLLLIALLSFYTCTNEPEVKEKLPNEQKVPKAYVFRGANFGMTKKQISTRESAKIIRATEEELVYSLDLNENDFADITYSFKQGRLYKIGYDLYTTTKQSADEFHKKFEKEFNDFYEGSGNIWDGAIKSTRFTVFLKQISTGNNNGLMVVWEVL